MNHWKFIPKMMEYQPGPIAGTILACPLSAEVPSHCLVPWCRGPQGTAPSCPLLYFSFHWVIFCLKPHEFSEKLTMFDTPWSIRQDQSRRIKPGLLLGEWHLHSSIPSFLRAHIPPRVPQRPLPPLSPSNNCPIFRFKPVWLVPFCFNIQDHVTD